MRVVLHRGIGVGGNWPPIAKGVIKSLGAEYKEKPDPDADVAVIMGVTQRKLWDFYKDRTRIYIDKGFIRDYAWRFVRVAINDTQPHHVIGRNYPHDRHRLHQIKTHGWRCRNKFVLYAASSQKYNDFHRLGPVDEYALRQIGKYARGHEVIYRPKPKYKGEPHNVPGVRMSQGTKRPWDDFKLSKVLITHGSSICVEAIWQGLPVIVTGNGLAKKFSCPDAGQLTFPTREEVYQWTNDICYGLWSPDEIARGVLWEHYFGGMDPSRGKVPEEGKEDSPAGQGLAGKEQERQVDQAPDR